MAQRRRYLPGRHLMVPLVSITLALTAALVWLGVRMIRQDRLLEEQRVRERLETAAGATTALLQRRLSGIEAELVQFDHAATRAGRLDEGALLVELRPGRVDAYPSGRLLYLPLAGTAAMSPAAFSPAEQLEFRVRDLEAAARLYAVLADGHDLEVRAGALLRLGRALRKAGRTTEAIVAYGRLAELDTIETEGLPAGLAGRFAALELGAASAEVETLLGDLLAGRWRLSRSIFEYHTEQLTTRLTRSGRTSPPVPREREALSRALDSLGQIWGTGSSSASGRSALMLGETPVLAVWRTEGDRRLLWLATQGHLSRAWLPELDSTLHRVGVVAGLRDSSGISVLGADASRAPPELSRSLAEIGLPWRLSLRRLDRSSAEAGLADRRRILLAGLIVAALLGLVGTYAVARAVSRELRVARLQSDFVSAVSHEFRTPLTSLRQLSELLAGGRVPTEERRRTYYDVLRHETVRLQRLVEGLLDFGRMEAGAREYRLDDVDTARLVTDVVQEFRQEPACTGYEITLAPPAPNCEVRADREALSRALWNLLDNAVKYSPERRAVAVEVARRNGHIEISVRDQGPGIPEAEQQAVFQKFVRGREAVASGARGTGLGLAMVRAILRAHGGDARVASVPGRGSTFVLSLPARSRS